MSADEVLIRVKTRTVLKSSDGCGFRKKNPNGKSNVMAPRAGEAPVDGICQEMYFYMGCCTTIPYIGLSSLLDLVFGSSLCSYQDEVSLIKDPERNPYPKSD